MRPGLLPIFRGTHVYLFLFTQFGQGGAHYFSWGWASSRPWAVFFAGLFLGFAFARLAPMVAPSTQTSVSLTSPIPGQRGQACALAPARTDMSVELRPGLGT